MSDRRREYSFVVKNVWQQRRTVFGFWNIWEQTAPRYCYLKLCITFVLQQTRTVFCYFKLCVAIVWQQTRTWHCCLKLSVTIVGQQTRTAFCYLKLCVTIVSASSCNYTDKQLYHVCFSGLFKRYISCVTLYFLCFVHFK